MLNQRRCTFSSGHSNSHRYELTGQNSVRVNTRQSITPMPVAGCKFVAQLSHIFLDAGCVIYFLEALF